METIEKRIELHHIIYQVSFVLYCLFSVIAVIAAFACIVAIPGQSDAETIAGISEVVHSEGWFIRAEMIGVAIMLLSWGLRHVMDYLCWVQQTWIEGLRRRLIYLQKEDDAYYEQDPEEEV